MGTFIGHQWGLLHGHGQFTQTLRNRVVLGKLAPGTWNHYRDLWTVHIEPDLGHLRLDHLTPHLIETWLAMKIASLKADGKPYSPRTIQALHATLRKALADATKAGKVPRNAALLVDGPRIPRREATVLLKAETQSLQAVIEQDPLKPLWTVLLGAGLRLGEALALRWSDIDLDKRRLTVARGLGELPSAMTSLDKPARRLGVRRTKTEGSSATVPLAGLVVDCLKQHKADLAQRRLAALVWEDHGLVFPSEIGTLLDPSNVRRKWKRVALAIGRDDLRVHDLRHSMATFLLAAGTPIKVVQQLLRHSRLATTADLYAHVLEEVSQDAVDGLDTYLRNAGFGS